jgi:hypothetical protein
VSWHHRLPCCFAAVPASQGPLQNH